MTNYISGDYDSPNAPWNEELLYCTECGSDQLEITDSGEYKGVIWYEYTCLECGNIMSEVPDYD